MALRGPLGASSGELMRDDAMPCSKQVKAFSTLAAVFGVLTGMPLCYIHYGPFTTRPRMLRWSAAGAVTCAAATAVFTILWEPACESQNISAYDSSET